MNSQTSAMVEIKPGQKELRCPRCARVKRIKGGAIGEQGRPLRVKCSCGEVFLCRFEARRKERGPARSTGFYLNLNNGERGRMELEDMSAHGVGFRVVLGVPPKPGDAVRLHCQAGPSVFKDQWRMATVINVNGDRIGARFNTVEFEGENPLEEPAPKNEKPGEHKVEELFAEAETESVEPVEVDEYTEFYGWQGGGYAGIDHDEEYDDQELEVVEITYHQPPEDLPPQGDDVDVVVEAQPAGEGGAAYDSDGWSIESGNDGELEDEELEAEDLSGPDDSPEERSFIIKGGDLALSTTSEMKIDVSDLYKVDIICPRCGHARVFDVDAIRSASYKVKFDCRCGGSFVCEFEARKHHRKSVNLEGEYRSLESGESDLMHIVDLSLGGAGLSLPFGHGIREGDRMELSFELDTPLKPMVVRKAAATFVKGGAVGACFVDGKRDSDLGFYLIG